MQKKLEGAVIETINDCSLQTSAGKHMRLSQILELPDNGLPKIAQKRQK